MEKDLFVEKSDYRVNVLLYHQVGDSPSRYTNLDCFCDTKTFHEQMQFLAHSNYKVLSLSQVLDFITGKKPIDANYVVLTFDDGCERFYDKALPILRAFDLPSTVYPVAAYLGKFGSWGTNKNPDLKILSKDRLFEIQAMGVEVGAHGMDHLKLTQIDVKEAIIQVKESKDVLEQLLGVDISSFSYPHGDFNSQIIEIVRESGFCNAVTCISQAANEAKSIYEIPRKYVSYYDDLNAFKQKLN